MKCSAREWGALVFDEQVRRIAVHRDSAFQILSRPSSAFERDDPNAGAEGGFNVVRRVAEHDRVRGIAPCFSERGMDDVGVRLGMIRIV